MSRFLNTDQLPFCKGCGHDLIAKHTANALEKCGYEPLNVVVVTDIGCHGIIDKAFNCHTVHGLHGRSVALGAGIALGKKNKHQKIIVFIGDGGVTIGLQHLMEASRLNIDMTVIIHNNFLYGMTGGQTSGLTPTGFNTTTSPSGNTFAQYDICELVHQAGAAYASRIIGIGDYSEKLSEAFQVKGFSLVEVFEVCTGYGVKFNPGRKLREIVESAGKTESVWRNQRPAFDPVFREQTSSLLDELKPAGEEKFGNMEQPLRLIISGSAGEGVQSAAAILARLAMDYHYHVTLKGSYPVTVGVGFSTAEIIISPEEILYHGTTVPDMVIITSEDGLKHNLKKIKSMKKGLLLLDASLEVPETGAEVRRIDFRGHGDKLAVLASLLYFARESKIIEVEDVRLAIQKSRGAEKLLNIQV